ncbi:acetate kinase [Sphaerisporangium krabiense]|uniref:Acetate kinase n=1 Tax=Sphaerisporangium krabiense TaxID=763782 RepID=A0A7W8Z5R9_9ACTN|nr:acetate kinase [Sphaerisporangium krabiense]MBB5627872.1 acetate kinase [Sphaerisporangium krabiense]GII62031.1 acetate kinase [Sphaerisporangium krabiense]
MILVLNSGSSSVKYQLIDLDGPTRVLVGGKVERIGEHGSPVPDHEAALRIVAHEVSLDSPELTAIGHRVVHGGPLFTGPVLITDDVVKHIAEAVPLAPLHNPANLAGIEITRRLRPDLPQVAVFDTAFHSTIPPAARTYAIDREIAERNGVRRYGFHGTSTAYVSRVAAELVGRPDSANAIVLHLGNGASASAVSAGTCVDTSMGMTPLEGLVMGTRSGDIDPAVIFVLIRSGMSPDEVEAMLFRHSGLQGLCGENDMRTVIARVEAGDPDAVLAYDVYCHRLRKYIGAYCAVLGRVDVIAFTGGVGENSPLVRQNVLSGLHPLGIRLDPVRNASASGTRLISTDDSAVAVAVIPTDEELEIALETSAVVARTKSP